MLKLGRYPPKKIQSSHLKFYFLIFSMFNIGEFSFSQLFSSHELNFCIFYIYFLVLAWQSIIKLNLELKILGENRPRALYS